MVVGDITTGTDLAVIGAGPAGYVAAIRAGQLDLDVTLVEREAIGGVCLNYGCIPSKALISATDVAQRAREGETFGVHANPAIDLSQMVEWKDGVVDRLTSGVEQLCEANGVNVLEGTATFADEHTLRVAHGGEGQGAETIQFEQAIIATGSRPIEIPGFAFDDEPVLDSRQALALEHVPDDLVVVGAGYIGMELAGVFAKAGATVTVLEMLDSILAGYEADLVRPVERRADDLGIDVRLETTAAGWEETDEGIVVHAEPAGDGDEAEAIPADRVLVAVGRRPVTDTVDLEALGLETDEDGFIPTDEQMRTDLEHVFAIGDVAGEPMLAHKGSAEGVVAAEAAAGEAVAADFRAVPAAVFTDPEIATVGLTEAEAEDAGFDPVVGRFPFTASGRALTTGHTDGFVRLVADDETGFVLGGQVVGPEASELIAEIALAVEFGARLEDVYATIHTHPTLAEAVKEAAENARGRAIHTLNR
ncbi:MAG: dihydrolipoyl dehydrogenase [Halobacteriales archaeon]